MTDAVQTRTVTIKEAIPAVKHCVKMQRPLMLWGPPGIGKSDLVAMLCNEMGGRLYDIRLPLLEPTDLRGIPFYNKEIGKMDWAAPIDMPDDETASQYPIVFLFLDELNGAAPAVQSAAYQLILNRKIGKYELPDNVVIIAAGNRESDKGVTYRMPSPLANRFIHLELRVDFDSWNDWAVNHRIHKDVVGFLNFSKGSLFDFDPRSPSRSFATPRSWDFVSQIVGDETASESVVSNLVAGAIGEGTAMKFMAHRKIASTLPNPTDILLGKVTTLNTTEISAMYSIVTSMCYELQDFSRNSKDYKKLCAMTDNFYTFMMNNMGAELNVMGMRTCVRVFEIPVKSSDLKSFDAFYAKYGKFVLAAV